MASRNHRAIKSAERRGFPSIGQCRRIENHKGPVRESFRSDSCSFVKPDTIPATPDIDVWYFQGAGKAVRVRASITAPTIANLVWFQEY